MNINRNNYETHLIDYLDGTLSDEYRSAVEQFLLMNPDIQAEVHELENCILPREDINFEAKQMLKIEDEWSELTLWMLQALDGTIAPEHSVLLDIALQEPLNAKEFEQLKATFLSSSNIAFNAKNELRMPGHLTDAQELELDAQNNLPSLKADAHRYEYKGELYFSETADLSSPNMLAAAYAEGDLTSEQFQQLRGSTFHTPEFKKAVEVLQRMRLMAPTLIYEEKKELKRRETPVLIFTPMFKRAMAIAAIFVLGITIWRPWEQMGPANAPQMAQDQPKENESGAAVNKELAMDQGAANDSLDIQRSTPVQRANRTAQQPVQREEVALVERPQQVETPNPAEIPQEAPAPEIPIFQLPQEDGQLADVTPAPLKSNAPSTKAMKTSERAEDGTVSVLGYIGDRLEERIEQSPVYAFFDKKKKEIFESKDQKESLRYERVSSAKGVKQKLVLWGIEFQRHKRAR